MLTEIILKRSESQVLEPRAWLLSGADPAAWLNEVSAWPARTETISFYPLANRSSAVPFGVLAVPDKAMTLPSGSRALPYGMVSPGFYVPIDGILYPPLDAKEIPLVLRHPVTVFHPSIGLSGFDQADVRRAWDFLLPCELIEERWNTARWVEPINTRLRGVRLAMTFSLENIFGEASEDIGSEPLSDLPSSAGEGRFPLLWKILNGAALVLMRVFIAILSVVPRMALSPTWLNAVENLAKRHLSTVSKNLDQERNRELNRLLEMLEKNPSEGLRHAISLAALAHRGKAAPSSKLGQRSMDFNLSRLGESRAVDGWSIPPQIRTSLVTRYRESAHRETSLGNFRRAACIFAELLGDFSAAAEILKRGRHFQEAAIIYRERLHNQIAEAECLALGGFPEEAIAIYEKLNRWLDVADLREKEGFTRQANEALRRAVDSYLKSGDVLAASRLLETRMKNPEEALRLLAATWHGGKQAMVCLEERFALLSRRHDHTAIHELLVNLGHQKIPNSLEAALVGQLTKLFESLVDDANRHAAAESARIHISQALAARFLDSADEISVLRSLTRLVPQDRLLKRDVTRFREPRISRPQSIPAKTPALIRRLTLRKMNTINLPKVGKWLISVGTASGFHAVARRGERNLFFTRGVWAGAMQSAEWEDSTPSTNSGFLLAVHGDDVLLGRLFQRLPQKKLPETDAFKSRNSQVGIPTWLPEDSLRITSSGPSLWVLRVVSERVVLANFTAGELTYSRDVTDELQAAGATGHGTTLSLDAQGSPGAVALGYGRHLLVLDQHQAIRLCDLGGRVQGLLPSSPANPGWVALLDTGAVFISADTLSASSLDEQMTMPFGAFLGDGHLVLISGTEGKVFHIEAGLPSPVAWFPFDQGAWLSISATTHPREFATFTEVGVVQRWQLPI